MTEYFNKKILLYTVYTIGKLLAAIAVMIVAAGIVLGFIWMGYSIISDHNIWTMIGAGVIVLIGCWIYALEQYDTEQKCKSKNDEPLQNT
jgi:intracellular septation protein A